MSRQPISWVASLFFLLVFSAVTEAVEVSGRVVNRTTNQPVAGQEVTLLGLRGGMVALATQDTDTGGRFRFVVAANPNENFLVRTAYRGVTYHQPALLAGGDRIEADLEVYDATSDDSSIERQAHDFFLEPHREHVRVTEVVVLNNRTDPPRAYLPNAPRASALAFRTPPEAGEDVQAFVAGPGGMPLRQQPQPGEEPHTHTLDYPLRPGTTQIEFSYAVPLTNNGYAFSKRMPKAAEPPRIVTPLAGIRLSGEALGEPREEPTRQVRFFTARLSAANELRFRVEVDPEAVAALPASEPEAPAGSVAAGEGSVTLIANPVSEARWYIVGLTFAVLALGLSYLYSLPRTGTPDESRPKPASRR